TSPASASSLSAISLAWSNAEGDRAALPRPAARHRLWVPRTLLFVSAGATCVHLTTHVPSFHSLLLAPAEIPDCGRSGKSAPGSERCGSGEGLPAQQRGAPSDSGPRHGERRAASTQRSPRSL